MDMFEIEFKQAMERHEGWVRELQLERQLPRKTRTNILLSIVNAVKAAASAQQSAHTQNARHTLATK